MDEMSIGIGFLCSDLKFHVSVQKSATAACGYRINRFVKLRSNIKQHQKNTKNMFSVLSAILEKVDLPLQQKYTDGRSVRKLMDFISESGMSNYLSDRDGFLMMEWVIDNPPPSTFDEFVEWAKLYDEQVC